MSGHHSHHVSVIHSRASVIRNQVINDHSENDQSDNNDTMISLSDLSYSDPSDAEWSLPQKRKVLFNYLQRTKVDLHLIGLATLINKSLTLQERKIITEKKLKL